MDEASFEILSDLSLPGLCPIALKAFEQGDEALLVAKQNRSRVEYYFTCTPSLPLFILNHYPEVDIITYLDADLFFFSDPAPIYQELGYSSIGIIAHRFSPEIRWREKYGNYNVGWLSFRRNDDALICLEWWREQCLEWCHDYLDGDRFADQKYLDKWPMLFSGVTVLEHKGANLALWNIANYDINCENEQIMVDEQSLIFYHFHPFQLVNRRLFDAHFAAYEVKPSKTIVQSIYGPYIRSLSAAMNMFPDNSMWYGLRYKAKNTWLPHPLRRLLSIGKGILVRRYIMSLNGQIIWLR